MTRPQSRTNPTVETNSLMAGDARETPRRKARLARPVLNTATIVSLKRDIQALSQTQTTLIEYVKELETRLIDVAARQSRNIDELRVCSLETRKIFSNKIEDLSQLKHSLFNLIGKLGGGRPRTPIPHEARMSNSYSAMTRNGGGTPINSMSAKGLKGSKED